MSSSIGSRHRTHSPASAARAVPVTEHPLHDRFEPQVEVDRRAFGDMEDFDAQICGRRHRA